MLQDSYIRRGHYCFFRKRGSDLPGQIKGMFPFKIKSSEDFGRLDYKAVMIPLSIFRISSLLNECLIFKKGDPVRVGIQFATELAVFKETLAIPLQVNKISL